MPTFTVNNGIITKMGLSKVASASDEFSLQAGGLKSSGE